MDLATYAAGRRTALDLLSVVPLVGAEPYLRKIASTETAMAQGVLAVLAEFWAHREGYDVRVGRIRGESDPSHATVEVSMANGRRLVLHPMGEALGLYADEVEEQGRDIDVWHVLVRDADGGIVTCDGGRSLIRTRKAGLNPQAAPGVIRSVLDDAPLLEEFGLGEAVS